MANNFFKDSTKAYSENLNDSLLVGNAFDWTVDVSLPSDTGSVFPNSSTIVMAKVADVSITPNSNLSIGSTIENNSSGSQVYRLTVYPNFNRFGGFKSISLTADSGVTFYIANKGGTSPIASNLDYDDLGNVPELKVLKEYDIVITIPSNKEVTGLEFVFQSSSADVSGSISQSNVTGLSDSLTTLNTQVAGLINANDEILNYDLTSSDYNPSIDSTVTVTCRVTDFYGEAVSGESVTLYCNGSSVSTSITNNDGVATWTVTCDEWGLQDFRVANTNIQVKVGGYKTTTPHEYYTLYEFEDRVGLKINIFNSITFPTSWRNVNDTIISWSLRPQYPITCVNYNSAVTPTAIGINVNNTGGIQKVEIAVKSLASEISTTAYAYLEWSKV